MTIKEQWAPMLANMRRLGMAGLVTRDARGWRNTMRYQPDSWRMLSGLLDAVADRADVGQTHAIALSFAGQMALRCAVADTRIRGVVTVGAPIREFFTDVVWQRQLPKVTIHTLAHMTGTKPDDIVGGLDGWALTGEQLASLDIPVSYGASLRDEIIPSADWQLLRDRVKNLEVIEFDDVHGSPSHTAEMQLWTARSLLRSRGLRNLQSAMVGVLLGAQRVRHAGDRFGALLAGRPHR